MMIFMMIYRHQVLGSRNVQYIPSLWSVAKVFDYFYVTYLFFCPCQAAVCLRTAKRATMEHGKPMTTSLSMESIVQSVAKAGVVGTVKVSENAALL